MKIALKLFSVAALIWACTISAAFAKDMYPATLEDGNLILVDGGMGVGYYVAKNSVNVREYAPPFYQIQIDFVPVVFSNEYYRENDTYVDGPYQMGEYDMLSFRYNWDTRTVFYQRDKIWAVWNVQKNYSHAEGNPLIPNAAEVAFVAAYNMRFFNNQTGYGGYPVIKEKLYRALGV